MKEEFFEPTVTMKVKDLAKLLITIDNTNGIATCSGCGGKGWIDLADPGEDWRYQVNHTYECVLYDRSTSNPVYNNCIISVNTLFSDNGWKNADNVWLLNAPDEPIKWLRDSDIYANIGEISSGIPEQPGIYICDLEFGLEYEYDEDGGYSYIGEIFITRPKKIYEFHKYDADCEGDA